jgi:hypothetical protein
VALIGFIAVKFSCFDHSKDDSRTQASNFYSLIHGQTFDVLVTPIAISLIKLGSLLPDGIGLRPFSRDHNLSAKPHWFAPGFRIVVLMQFEAGSSEFSL